MSPIVLSKEKRRHNTKTKQKFYVTIVLSKEKEDNTTKTKVTPKQNKTKVLCHPLFYLKKNEKEFYEPNNTKTKHEFYVTHCFI